MSGTQNGESCDLPPVNRSTMTPRFKGRSNGRPVQSAKDGDAQQQRESGFFEYNNYTVLPNHPIVVNLLLIPVPVSRNE